ncbi:MAG TPA: Ig-like domain repeat protein [Terracidiphilus sp.]|nr:Ig-like domain repeat protein [Terracidiphilus sp.]
MLALSACGGGGANQGTGNPPPSNPTTPTVTVTPSPATVTTVLPFTVTVAVAGSGATPTGTVTLKSGSYTSPAATLAGGSAAIQIAQGTLPVGTDSMTASYTPDGASSSAYNSATGNGSVTVNKATPAVAVSPAQASYGTGQAVQLTVSVSAGSAAPAATGSVTVTSGSYTSAAAPLTNGSAAMTIPAGSIAVGNDTLTATYTPDTAGAALYNNASGSGAVTITPLITPTVTVTPPTGTVYVQQSLQVTISVSGGTGNPAATGTVTLKSGTYTSAATTLASGSAAISVSGLPAGNDVLTATYTPDTAAAATYSSASGGSAVSVNKVTPVVTATPAATNITTAQDLKVTVVVTDSTTPNGGTPTGSVILSSGSYSSAATTLTSGTGSSSAQIDIPAFTLTAGTANFTAVYTPDSTSLPNYKSATSNASSTVTVTQMSVVSVNQGVSGPALTDQLLGMNMAAWFDPTSSYVVPTFKAAGIKATRWPGGSWSDIYHWQTNSTCQGTPPNLSPGGWANPAATYTNFINDVELAGGLDVAMTANYGTNAACTGGGDPTEASNWVQAWETAGGTISHVTVGNEDYGASWETDLHAKPHDPATYANATVTGYYPDIKAIDKNVQVGVVVDANCTTSNGCTNGWDSTVLANAKGYYDFVEFHYYPQYYSVQTGPITSDTYLVQQAANDFTTNINTIKTELATAGEPNTPIYIGEIGANSGNPGTQSWSITQGLYAGQLLGEAMNDGISRLTWWIGFGNCLGAGNNSPLVYGWQNTWGSYDVFSDADPNCPGAGPAGTMSPTGRAFQLFSNVLVDGEKALAPPTVQGDTTDVRGYAATHAGGTALVLFNLNETTSEPVTISLSAEQSSNGVTVITYSKAIYDDSKNGKWDPPTTTNMGAQALPLTLTLDPWSMNVVIIQ